MQGLHTVSLAFTSPIHRIRSGPGNQKVYWVNNLGLRLSLFKFLNGYNLSLHFGI